MDRRKFMKLTVLSAASVAGGTEIAGKAKVVSASSKKSLMRHKGPNVLVILPDQHNAKVLGCRNHPDVKTPNLDRLVSEGVYFDNAIVQNPICTPSRVSWWSGQYCHNHGYYGLCGPKPKGLPTIFGHFRKAGYRTGAVGKVHCPENWIQDDTDFFGDECEYRPNNYFSYLKKKGLYKYLDSWYYPEDSNNKRYSFDGRASRLKYEDSIEGWAVRESINFMSQSVADANPFFLYTGFMKPHSNYCPSEPFWSMYDESKLTLPPNAEYDNTLKSPALRLSAEGYRARPEEWLSFEPRTFEAGRLRKLHGYLGCVSHMDHAVGELMTWLERSGLAENTIVVYSTDHGEYACEHGIMEKSPGICSDAVTRVPCIWRWPKHFKSGHIVEEIFESVDFTQTVCSIAGLEQLETSDGKDCSHLLKGERGEVHKIGVTEGPWSKSIRKGKYRFVYYPREMFPEHIYHEKAYPNGNFGELYNLEADPWEMNNLYFNPKYAAIVDEFRKDLIDWLVTTERPATIHPHVRFKSNQAETIHRNTVNSDGKISPDWIRKQRNRNYL